MFSHGLQTRLIRVPAEARARNSAAGALEEDARLTALFLWTLQSTEKNGHRQDACATAASGTGFQPVARFPGSL